LGFDEIRDLVNLKDFSFFLVMVEKEVNEICKTSTDNRIKLRLNREMKIKFAQIGTKSMECIIQ
jgi:hypothetical protein